MVGVDFRMTFIQTASSLFAKIRKKMGVENL